MTMQTFDPYYHWLGIPPQEQPPNYYRLVGAPLYEQNPAVIAAAADRWLGFLAGMSQTEYAGAANRLYQEISYAKMYLCHPQQKPAYDAWLQQMAASGSSISRASGSTITGNPAPPVNPSASSIARGSAPQATPATAYNPQTPNYGSSYGSTGYAPIPTIPGAPNPASSSIMASPGAAPYVPQVPQAPAGYGGYAAPVAAAPATASAPAPAAPVVTTDAPSSLARPDRGFNPITFAAIGGSLVAVGIVVFAIANAKPAAVKTAQHPSNSTATTTPKPTAGTTPETVRTEPTAPKPPAERPVFKPVIPGPTTTPDEPKEPASETPMTPETMKPETTPVSIPEEPAMEEPAAEKPVKTKPNDPAMSEDPAMAAPTDPPGPGDEPGLSAVTPTTVEEAPTEKPAEATPEQQAQFTRFLKAARLALSEREFEAAAQELEKAKKSAVTPDQKAALARSEQMLEQLTQLWDGITQQMNLMVAGQEFEVKGKIVVVVETSDQLLIARSVGKQYRWDRKNMPTSIARWIAGQWFKADAALSVMLGTHYLLDKEGADPVVARSMLDDAARDPNAKPIVEALRLEL